MAENHKGLKVGDKAPAFNEKTPKVKQLNCPILKARNSRSIFARRL